jgi:hypothetical protein
MIDFDLNEMGSYYFYLDNGTYEGDYNQRQERHGVGICTYADGSYYEGSWDKN